MWKATSVLTGTRYACIGVQAYLWQTTAFLLWPTIPTNMLKISEQQAINVVDRWCMPLQQKLFFWNVQVIDAVAITDDLLHFLCKLIPCPSTIFPTLPTTTNMLIYKWRVHYDDRRSLSCWMLGNSWLSLPCGVYRTGNFSPFNWLSFVLSSTVLYEATSIALGVYILSSMISPICNVQRFVLFQGQCSLSLLLENMDSLCLFNDCICLWHVACSLKQKNNYGGTFLFVFLFLYDNFQKAGYNNK